MPWVGFGPTIPIFQRTKTFHASDRAATVIGHHPLFLSHFNRKFSKTPQHRIHDLFCSSRKHEDTQTNMAKLVDAFLSPFFANAPKIEWSNYKWIIGPDVFTILYQECRATNSISYNRILLRASEMFSSVLLKKCLRSPLSLKSNCYMEEVSRKCRN